MACDLTALNVVVALLADHVRGQQRGGEEDSHGAGSELSSEELLLNAVAASTNIILPCIQTDTYANMLSSSEGARCSERRRTSTSCAAPARST